MQVNSQIDKKVFNEKEAASKYVAGEIAQLIKKNDAVGKRTILGLATGSSPIQMYNELVRLHKEEGLTFKNVTTFNLDEYYPMAKDSDKSYHYFMHHHLFDHIDIAPEHINIPDGTLGEELVDGFCQSYEDKIDALGDRKSVV